MLLLGEYIGTSITGNNNNIKTIGNIVLIILDRIVMISTVILWFYFWNVFALKM